MVEFLLEHLGDLFIALELLLLKIFGKSETLEEKKKRLIAKRKESKESY